jgi:hypothetical protein
MFVLCFADLMLMNNVRFEVLTAVNMKMTVFCHHPDDGGSKHL